MRPQLRPVRTDPMRTVGSLPREARACAVDFAAVPVTSWRLTERGAAVITLVVGMVIVAALTVVGLTALRVTGESYAPTGIAAPLTSP